MRVDSRLSDKEKQTLDYLENIVSEGIDTWQKVGTALEEICRQRLYREDHDTFEDYCKNRWGISRSRAYQLMSAIKAARNVSTMVEGGIPFVTPQSERQIRTLAALPPEKQIAAWDRAIEETGGLQPTARHLDTVARTMAQEERTGSRGAETESITLRKLSVDLAFLSKAEESLHEARRCLESVGVQQKVLDDLAFVHAQVSRIKRKMEAENN